ncbi:TetR/AcrR family transcriptional regulator [Streptomyces sp. NPDC049954]|uniref:TetR/AcrR family transcriptional regulator n=1 Tax=Streptomyces sp. NPDC049954 TaxID=3155779 RepID=UPI00342C1623
MTTRHTYHHGDLRRAVLAAAVEVIERDGPARLSLRDLARRAGVSHAGPVHHFGDKAGVLTALATEGYGLLADALEASPDGDSELVELGVSYVRFAVRHPAHFAVMFRLDLLHPEDPDLCAARQRARALLTGGVERVVGDSATLRPELAGVAAWSLVHGYASLHLAGALPEEASGEDVEGVARAVAALLFRSP